MSRVIITLSTILIFGCGTPTDKLFWIDESTGQRNDFLFLAEDTNAERLQSDSLKIFLTQSELDSITTPPTSYRNFGQISKQDNFKVFVILQEIDTVGRNYNFLIRTYDNAFKIIDSFKLGTWDENKRVFCYGSINRDLIIERKCDDSEATDIMQITKDGKIVMTSYHKP
jgi:hypothetical protein